MDSMQINHIRLKLYQLTNSLQKEVNELNQLLDDSEATKMELNEFKELFELSEETISTSLALANSNSEWSKVPPSDEEEENEVNPNFSDGQAGFRVG